MIYLVPFIISAIICGAIAKSKNKNVLLWVVLGFLFPLISIVILALSANSEAQLGPAAIAVPSNTQGYDRTKWQALMQYDPEIQKAARALLPLGPNYVDRLARLFGSK